MKRFAIYCDEAEENADGEWVRYADLVPGADDPVVDDPRWLRNEVRRQRSVLKEVYAEVERLRVERECAAQQVEFLCEDVRRLRAGYVAERGNAVSIASELAAATELLREAAPLWREWRETDITDDDDRWASFTDRGHDWHDRVCAHIAKQGK